MCTLKQIAVSQTSPAPECAVSTHTDKVNVNKGTKKKPKAQKSKYYTVQYHFTCNADNTMAHA